MGQKVLAGRYEILEKIGDGGMAVVYRARDKLLSRMVAIKILRPEFVKDTTFVESFRRESRAAASLSHPNIVGIYDVGEEGNIYFIVMELVEGRTLSDVIDMEGPLDYKIAISIAKQVASALSLAHKNNIVHRDVKPHNILITDDGSAKITDFGIAKAVTERTIVSDNNTVMGSAHYFSPEQGRGQYVDEKSDIYSMGIVLYEMLTGRVPFDADNPVTIALMHMNDAIVPPSRYAPGIPPGLEQVVMKATEKYQVNRFKTIDEMYVALDNVNFVTGIIEDPLARSYVARPDAALAGAAGAAAAAGVRDGYDPAADADYGEENYENYDEDDANDQYYNDAYDEDDEDEIADGGYVRERKPKKQKAAAQRGNAPKKKGERSGALPFILAVVVALALAYPLYLGIQWLTSDKGNETVPRLIDLSPEEAETVVSEAGFKLQVLESTRTSETVSEGAIMEQNPGADSHAKKGTTIEVVVSSGPREKTGEEEPEEKEPLKVPDVVGKNETDAEFALKQAGFSVNIKYEDNERPAGRVFKQDPKAQTEVQENTAVTITVSTGPKVKEVKAPNLSGMTKSAAEKALKDKKLEAGKVTEEFSDEKKGTVISQSPKSGATMTEGDKVDFVLSKGPEEVERSTRYAIYFDNAETDVFNLTVQMTDSKGKTSYIVRDQQHMKSEGQTEVTLKGMGECTVNVFFGTKKVLALVVDFSVSPVTVEEH